MTLNEYQQHALETAIYPEQSRIVYPTLGLTGEAGEVADKVMKEIGDVLWYCATLSHDLGYDLEEVARTNVEKLRSRMERHRITGSGDNR